MKQEDPNTVLALTYKGQLMGYRISIKGCMSFDISYTLLGSRVEGVSQQETYMSPKES